MSSKHLKYRVVQSFLAMIKYFLVASLLRNPRDVLMTFTEQILNWVVGVNRRKQTLIFNLLFQ